MSWICSWSQCKKCRKKHQRQEFMEVGGRNFALLWDFTTSFNDRKNWCCCVLHSVLFQSHYILICLLQALASFEGAEDVHSFCAMWLYTDLSNISGVTCLRYGASCRPWLRNSFKTLFRYRNVFLDQSIRNRETQDSKKPPGSGNLLSYKPTLFFNITSLIAKIE